MNTVFSPDAERALFDAMAAELAPYVEENIRRWPELDGWDHDLEQGRDVIRRRRDLRQKQLQSNFRLGELAAVRIHWFPEQGSVRLNGMDVGNTASAETDGSKRTWSGNYYAGMEITVTAKAQPGWRFVGWHAGKEPRGYSIAGPPHRDPADPSMTVHLEGDVLLRPRFVAH